MASTTKQIQHSSHDHPLLPRQFSKDSILPLCHLCCWQISSDCYACEECEVLIHRACAEAPPRIDRHPLHTDHPLTLSHRRPASDSKGCNWCSCILGSTFRCDECDFDLDLRCALSTLSDQGGTQGKTPEQIELPLHPHKLTSFSTRHEFVGDSECVICKESVEGEGYTCLVWYCKFLIHKRCVPDLYYADASKAPQVYHRHPLETLILREDMGSTRCASCESNVTSGEFVGCATCEVFIHRDCIQVLEIIQYPRHPNHTLVLLIDCPDNEESQCDSCTVSLKGKLCYGCPSCEFFVDVGCALHLIDYCEKGMSSEIELSWHEHPLHLYHGTESHRGVCYICEDKPDGPIYVCLHQDYELQDCELQLHKRCSEIEHTIVHPHHPDHPLTLGNKDGFQRCQACINRIYYLSYSCELCAFYLHAKCAAHVPTRKHSLHEHELLHLKEAPLGKCNHCRTQLSSPFFRCVPCDFNLHETCMDLPPKILNSKIHWHGLTLHETYLEDDSGEYYCDQCEQRRDGRMGAYVCLQCTQRWAFHIECVLPELHEVCGKELNAAEIEILARDITQREREVGETETKLDEMKRQVEEMKCELDEMKRQLDEQRRKFAALKQ